jgi:hypothetical protein
MDTSHFPGIRRTETPVARPPSPPYIHVPTTLDNGSNTVFLHPITTVGGGSLSPVFDLGQGTSITREEIELITQNQPQLAPRSEDWTYESRRQAQPILSFLYLGPVSAVRNAAFLCDHGITMLLAARDVRQAAARLLAVSKTAADLGIASDTVDVSGRAELISAIPQAIGKINAHLLAMRGRGKVLVCCETGNERSAALVAAYLMTMYDADLVGALQFVHYKRFCANFDDDIKFLLRGYGDLVAARRMVNTFPHQQGNGVLGVGMPDKKGKRGIGEASVDDGNEEEVADGAEMDLQRFQGRHLTPFVDGGADVRGDEAMGLDG